MNWSPSVPGAVHHLPDFCIVRAPAAHRLGAPKPPGGAGKERVFGGLWIGFQRGGGNVPGWVMSRSPPLPTQPVHSAGRRHPAHDHLPGVMATRKPSNTLTEATRHRLNSALLTMMRSINTLTTKCGSLAQSQRYAVYKSEMLSKSAAIKHQIDTRGVAHQPQIAALFRSEILGLDQHPQAN